MIFQSHSILQKAKALADEVGAAGKPLFAAEFNAINYRNIGTIEVVVLTIDVPLMALLCIWDLILFLGMLGNNLQLLDPLLKVQYIHTADQLADNFSKPLSQARFIKHRTKLCLQHWRHQLAWTC
ncbi:uncharacterized protein LOC127806090 isoform X2 [Diospyros lotus]|uniref:uncharacterized protein LOC127806090 isoform X2 n=1 Tax=Diospyros lotus TaxID=55363 RepID=UPI00224E1F64|nr:uncharacterized protein LOC127806090 isoform X2 [Diospyros lotus]